MTPQTRAQTRSSAETAEAAEAVVRTAFAEIEAMRWDAVASLMHPVTLKRFREWQIDLARTSERQLDEGSRDHERNLPPEVAAWFDAQRKKEEEYWEQHGPRLSHTFAGIETIEELESLSAAELFARYLQAQDPREQALRQAQREGKEISIAGIEKKLMVEERVVIGSVAEDDSTVQVVCRTRSKLKLIPEDDEGRVEVITVRRTPEGWRILAGPSDSIFLEGPSYGIYGLQTEEEQEQALRELAEKVVTWPVEGGGEGRAFITGYTEDKEPPKGLVAEVARPDGMVERIEIPVTGFGAIAELISWWSLSPEGEKRATSSPSSRSPENRRRVSSPADTTPPPAPPGARGASRPRGARSRQRGRPRCRGALWR